MIKPFEQMASFGRIFAAAQRVSHAVEVHRRPAAADLETLGVNPKNDYFWR